MNLFFLGVLRPKKIFGTIFTSQIVQREKINFWTIFIIVKIFKILGSKKKLSVKDR